jgi:hypothetical protein
MITFETFVKRWGGLKKFIIKRTNQLMKEMGDEIVKMITDQQHEGINAEGEKMQTGYSSGYGKKRRKKGLQTRFVDLHFSGKMHKGMKVRAAKDGIDIRSKEPYEHFVRVNFPKGFSLTEEHSELVGNIVAEKLAVEIDTYFT